MSTNPTTTPTQVTIDRVIETMSGLGTTLEGDISGRAAQANLNDFTVLFVLLDTVLIVRTDAATDVPSNTPDATLYLAANQVNSSYLDARAIVVTRDATLTVRTESELNVAAGLTDEQLGDALERAVNAVLETQDAMVVLAEQMEQLRDQAAGNETG